MSQPKTTPRRISERALEQALRDLLDRQNQVDQVWTFEDAGVLTRNRGLEVTIGKNEFQITIVKKR